MASRLTLGVSNALINGKFHFEYLKDTSLSSKKIKHILGEQYYNHTLNKQDRYCEVLLEKEDLRGFFIYMKKLQTLLDRTGFLQVKCFDVIKQGKEDYETVLLNRVKELAQDMKASGIFISISPLQKIELSYWKGNGFKTVDGEKKDGIEIYMNLETNKVHPEMSKNLEKKQAEGSSKKRKLDELEDRNGDSQSKKRKLSTTNEKSDSLRSPEVNSVKKNNGHVSFQHNLPMKGVIFLNKIMEGTKKFEGRIYRATCRKMRVKDELKLFDRSAGWGIVCEITSLDVYTSFEDMLKAKGILALLPQLEGDSKTLSPENLMQKAIQIYQGFPGSNGVHTDGVAAIGVKFLRKVQQ